MWARERRLRSGKVTKMLATVDNRSYRGPSSSFTFILFSLSFHFFAHTFFLPFDLSNACVFVDVLLVKCDASRFLRFSSTDHTHTRTL